MTTYGETLSAHWAGWNDGLTLIKVRVATGELCVGVSAHTLTLRLQTPQDNVWRGMFLIGLLAMQLSSRAMPPVRR